MVRKIRLRPLIPTQRQRYRYFVIKIINSDSINIEYISFLKKLLNTFKILFGLYNLSNSEMKLIKNQFKDNFAIIKINYNFVDLLNTTLLFMRSEGYLIKTLKITNSIKNCKKVIEKWIHLNIK